MDFELNYTLIGERIRAARLKKGYTQENTAERSGISAQHCSGIECGNAKVSLPALVRLCNALDASPDDILMDSINRVTPQLMENVASVFSDCSPDEIFLMLSQADNLKKALRQKRLAQI
ncbi:MAG: helix-turn-helix transcriptional regulator [Defluviitaleaceae bacterium]|nr:helix-turn-helix transcriptional regulator [Defluviitaleaceae bacterium]MCL2262207.1 helix-turn-helix transcriptional regulator [Defluviitaleaceae bacterium]